MIVGFEKEMLVRVIGIKILGKKIPNSRKKKSPDYNITHNHNIK